jgi:hypothetical protein
MRSALVVAPGSGLLAVTLAVLTSACGPTARQGEGPAGETPRHGEAPTQGVPATPNETAQQRVQRLEREARALVRAEGCQTGGECRAAPVGDRPCGGPRTYLVYCARTTDSVALYRKLDELARAERAYNQEQGLMSTCEFRTPPAVTAEAGSCRAAAP